MITNHVRLQKIESSHGRKPCKHTKKGFEIVGETIIVMSRGTGIRLAAGATRVHKHRKVNHREPHTTCIESSSANALVSNVVVAG